MSIDEKDILDLIDRRRRQILVHSIIYYELNENIVSDHQWAEWALELEDLQKRYPNIASKAPYAKEFDGFDHSTGQNLPLHDPWGVKTAVWLLKVSKKYGG